VLVGTVKNDKADGIDTYLYRGLLNDSSGASGIDVRLSQHQFLDRVIDNNDRSTSTQAC
jgi:hypothetical protein